MPPPRIIPMPSGTRMTPAPGQPTTHYTQDAKRDEQEPTHAEDPFPVRGIRVVVLHDLAHAVGGVLIPRKKQAHSRA
jgi:hypothetical protein